MPNDCYNIIQGISHDDPEFIKRLVVVLSQEKPSFFSAFIPCPSHETPVSYWGTKWDVYDVDITEINENNLGISFYTAWTPPFNAYSQLEKIGFSIDAMFMESGFDYCGYWSSSIDFDERSSSTSTDDRGFTAPKVPVKPSHGKKIMFENVKDRLEEIPEDFHFYFQDNNEEEEEEDL